MISTKIKVEDKIMRLSIWDTAGQERFSALTGNAYKGAKGIMICYSTASLQSFNNVKKWVDDIKQRAADHVNVILVATKCDLVEEREVSFEDGKNLAEQLEVDFYETSSKDNMNITEALMGLAILIKRKMDDGDDNMSNPSFMIHDSGGYESKVAVRKCC